MAVAIIPKFTKADITRILTARKERIFAAILLRLKRIGEQFVKNARENGTYRDVTGNLRSSIGYVILHNGIQITENTKLVRKGKEGPGKAREVLNELKAQYPKGFVLICVAGMEYAASVERRGREVITASSHQAEIDLRQAIREIKSKAGNLAA